MKPVTLGCVALLALCLPASASPAASKAAELPTIEGVIKSSLDWALTKDKDLLYSALAQDSSFFIFHPDSGSTIVGFEAFTRLTDSFFMDPRFKAVRSEVRDLRIHLSQGGDVAWWSALLDDVGEWDGKPTAWVNARWTGVLEKRAGRWVIVQMHFSLPSP